MQLSSVARSQVPRNIPLQVLGLQREKAGGLEKKSIPEDRLREIIQINNPEFFEKEEKVKKPKQPRIKKPKKKLEEKERKEKMKLAGQNIENAQGETSSEVEKPIDFGDNLRKSTIETMRSENTDLTFDKKDMKRIQRERVNTGSKDKKFKFHEDIKVKEIAEEAIIQAVKEMVSEAVRLNNSRKLAAINDALVKGNLTDIMKAEILEAIRDGQKRKFDLELMAKKTYACFVTKADKIFIVYDTGRVISRVNGSKVFLEIHIDDEPGEKRLLKLFNIEACTDERYDAFKWLYEGHKEEIKKIIEDIKEENIEAGLEEDNIDNLGMQENNDEIFHPILSSCRELNISRSVRNKVAEIFGKRSLPREMLLRPRIVPTTLIKLKKAPKPKILSKRNEYFPRAWTQPYL